MELSVRYKGEEHVLQVKEDDIILFPSGLVGFSQWRRFVLLEDPDEAPIAILQCLDDIKVCFLVTDPSYVSPNYSVQLPAEELEKLGLSRMEDSRVLCTLTLKDGPAVVTANLLGPILINPEARVARQVILQDSPYSAQHPVLMVRA